MGASVGFHEEAGQQETCSRDLDGICQGAKKAPRTLKTEERQVLRATTLGYTEPTSHHYPGLFWFRVASSSHSQPVSLPKGCWRGSQPAPTCHPGWGAPSGRHPKSHTHNHTVSISHNIQLWTSSDRYCQAPLSLSRCIQPHDTHTVTETHVISHRHLHR